MPKLYDILNKQFRFNGGRDNMPILATPRDGRERGRQAIAQVMAELGFTRGMEIGTKYGQSARIWAEAIPHLTLVCIDPYKAYHHSNQEKQDKIYEDAKRNIARHAEETGAEILLDRRESLEVVSSLEDEIVDFVNVDGNHTFDACVQDIIQWVPKVKPGGLVLVHDYCTFRLSGVIRAVDAYTHCHRIEPWYVTRDYEPTAFWQRGTERA